MKQLTDATVIAMLHLALESGAPDTAKWAVTYGRSPQEIERLIGLAREEGDDTCASL